jgi:hypothetical protein
MGACEMILHHDNAALEAWGRVPPQASEAPLAALSRARLASEVGRYRLAETCLQSAIPADGDIGEEAWRLLGMGKGTSLNSASLAPKPLASSVYVRVPEAPCPHKRSISVASLFPSRCWIRWCRLTYYDIRYHCKSQ